LSAIPKQYGNKTTWKIAGSAVQTFIDCRHALEELKVEEERQQNTPPLSTLVNGFRQAMVNGELTGKAFSSRTVDDYLYYVNQYVKQNESFDKVSVSQYLSSIPAKQFATREKAYKALVCFGKQLVAVNVIDDLMLDSCRKLRPVANKPPHRPIPKPNDVERILELDMSPLDRVLVGVCIHTGLRANEIASLTVDNFDREAALLAFIGKGGKERVVGLNDVCLKSLENYLDEARPGSPSRLLLLNDEGLPLTRHAIASRIRRLGERVGIKTSPHALRRYFATKHAVAGRSLAMLQRVLGHSSLGTTEKYIQATSLQAAEEMKGW
jgi:site-specific recombinase XerD